MYWFRAGSAAAIIPWLAVTLLWWLGGWLLARQFFKLERRERVLLGFGLGLVLYTWLVNLLGHWLDSRWAFSLPAALVFLAGLLTRRVHVPLPLDWGEWRDVWRWLLAGAGLFYLFVRISKGLAIFDEQKNLSLISIMAAGDIPPHFYAYDYPIRYIYHYGFQLYAASLMRLGGMLPWSAFDVGKSIVWAYAVLLAGMVGQRALRRSWGAPLLAAVFTLATGTRYLLLLLPPGILLRADSAVKLAGTSAFIDLPFSQALLHGWTIDGGPPSAYIFAFLNGILDPFIMSHQGPQAFSLVIFFLVWLLAPRLQSKASIPLLVIIYALWALAWETTYALFLLGAFLTAGLLYLRKRGRYASALKATLLALALSVPIVLMQGGTLTEMAKKIIFRYDDAGLEVIGALWRCAAASPLWALASAWMPSLQDSAPLFGLRILGFSIQWPPAILSAHFAPLNIFSPIELLVGLFELGPVVLFTPWITRWAWRRSEQHDDWIASVLALSAWVGLLVPMFLNYEAGRDISRLTWQSLVNWTLLLTIMAAGGKANWTRFLRETAIIGLVLMCIGGLVTGGIQMTAMTSTQLGYRYTELDAEFMRLAWGIIPEDARLLGPIGSSTVLTGHLTGQLLGDAPSKAWTESFESLELGMLRTNLYDFLLITNRTVTDLSVNNLASLEADPCVETLVEVWDTSRVNFRKLFDLRGCRP